MIIGDPSTPEHSKVQKPLALFEDYFKRMKSNDDLQTGGAIKILENDHEGAGPQPENIELV